jgi:hypothetical protein
MDVTPLTGKKTSKPWYYFLALLRLVNGGRIGD